MKELCREIPRNERTTHQQVVYALVARTLEDYGHSPLKQLTGNLIALAFVAVGLVLGLLVTGLLARLLSLLCLGKLIVVVIALHAVWLGRVLQRQSREAPVTFSIVDGRVDGFELGRIHEVFGFAPRAIHGWFFGSFCGMQQALLMVAPDHCGLPIEGGFGECLLLTLNNVCNGLCFDVFRLHELYWTSPVPHSRFSACIFLVFRLAFDGLAVLIGFSIWKRFSMERLWRSLPADVLDMNSVLNWIETSCCKRDNWPNRYHDEFLFLLLCGAYINGRFDYVRQLSGDLRSIRVERPVRELFQSPDGECVFVTING